jgi:hypothetical protein
MHVATRPHILVVIAFALASPLGVRPVAAQDTTIAASRDTTGTNVSARPAGAGAIRVLRPGAEVRVLMPAAPPRDDRVRGVFTAIDSTALPWTVTIATPAGSRSIPCSIIGTIEVSESRHIARWRQAVVVLGLATAGVYASRALTRDPSKYYWYGAPTPWELRHERRRRQRATIAGAVIGGGTGYFLVRDRARWHSVSLGSCMER